MKVAGVLFERCLVAFKLTPQRRDGYFFSISSSLSWRQNIYSTTEEAEEEKEETEPSSFLSRVCF